MQGYILLAAGLVLFLPALFKFAKANGDKKTLQIFGIVAFVGLVLAIIGCGLLVVKFFPSIPSKIVSYMMFLGFGIGGIVFLSPGFKGSW